MKLCRLLSILFLLCLLISVNLLHASAYIMKNDSLNNSESDTLSGFSKFNAKAEHLFTIIPFPIITYSTDAGNTFGLAKYNMIDMYKNDTITLPTKISGVFTASTKGRINASLATELVFKENKFILISYFNYKNTPEYIFGIGNNVKRADYESITTERFTYVATGLYKIANHVYAGAGLNITNYFSVKTDSTSFLIEDNISGVNGGLNVGVGLSAAYDSRDYRYNATKGSYLIATLLANPSFLGSDYNFTKFHIDARKFIQPWFKHVIAFQATTSARFNDTPFYELSLMGGDASMRGYYQGAIRDNILIDSQIEYRMPVWNIFGVVAWFGAGRVAPSYSQMSFNDLWLSYGGGLRIKVDSKHDTNLRLDFGFGQQGISGFYINFAEAF